MLTFADCVVRKSEPDVRALTLGPVGSQAEQEAAARIVPLLQGCLPQGYVIHFSRQMLFGYLAEALFNQARAGRKDVSVTEAR